MENKIAKLRIFFKITNSTFEFVNNIQLITNGVIIENKMQMLHKIALNELEKENPDLSIIDNLLNEMSNIAEENKQHGK